MPETKIPSIEQLSVIEGLDAAPNIVVSEWAAFDRHADHDRFRVQVVQNCLEYGNAGGPVSTETLAAAETLVAAATELALSCHRSILPIEIRIERWTCVELRSAPHPSHRSQTVGPFDDLRRVVIAEVAGQAFKAFMDRETV